VFPVRYELNVYVLFGRNSVFKGLTRTQYNTKPRLATVARRYDPVFHSKHDVPLLSRRQSVLPLTDALYSIN
jgi:hypothetical protein